MAKSQNERGVEMSASERPVDEESPLAGDHQPIRAQRRDRVNLPPRPAWQLATFFAFTLAIVCSVALGYALVRFFNVLSLPSRGTHEIVFLARAGILGVATTLAITFVMLGFATFMIGARGEFRVEGEHAGSKGLLASGAPGLFFVLCGTIVLCVLLNQKFSFEGSDTRSGPQQTAADANFSTESDAGGVVGAGRSVASGDHATVYEEIGFFTQDVSAFNAFAQLVAEGKASDDGLALFLQTWVKPIRITCVRFEWYRGNHTIPKEAATAVSLEGDKRFNLQSGYLIVPDDGRLLNAKLGELRAAAANGQPNLGPNVEELLPMMQTAYVFKAGEPMDDYPADRR
jgi:hypothetical protein